MSKRHRIPREAQEDIWIQAYNEQEPDIWKIAEDEKFKQCLDRQSFNGKFYDPKKVISNYGRVWSLNVCRFIKQDRSISGYYRVPVSALGKTINPRNHLMIHQTVANYFCDKKAVEIYGEANVKAHHKYSHKKTHLFYKPEKGKYNKYWINYWGYIHWTVEDEHDRITRQQKAIPDPTKYPDRDPFVGMWTETKGLGSLSDLTDQEMNELENELKARGLTIDDIKIVNSKLHGHSV